MSGGLIQLVSASAQDIILTGNPSKTFFKSTYHKYTNFNYFINYDYKFKNNHSNIFPRCFSK